LGRDTESSRADFAAATSQNVCSDPLLIKYFPTQQAVADFADNLNLIRAEGVTPEDVRRTRARITMMTLLLHPPIQFPGVWLFLKRKWRLSFTKRFPELFWISFKFAKGNIAESGAENRKSAN
jgi:hypothetical protein